MTRIWTDELRAHAGEPVRLAGWMHRLRRLSRRTFLVLRDGRGTAQVVIEDPQALDRLSGVHHESVIEVEGVAVVNPQAPGGVEVHHPEIRVLAPSAAPPLVELFHPTPKAALPTLLDHAALALRHPRARARFRLAAAACAGFREALRVRKFVEVHTPKIVGGATESGASVFRIDYFGRPAYLAQSPQLYKQILVGVFERVFEVGPVFRAEPHDTPRHLNEYVSLDAEMGFIEDHTTVMEVVADVVRAMAAAMQDEAADALALLEVPAPEVPAAIPAIHFVEAMERAARGLGAEAAPQPDLAPEHERWLGEWCRRTHGSEFLFVVGFPMAGRPFYTHPDPERPQYSRGFDLLFRGAELVTGGQRLHRYHEYVAALEQRGMSPEPFEGYLEAFRHGMPPHGGFAIGLERWVAGVAGVANIREATLFPRDQQRLFP